jgi:beta-carotene 3-hydroxylase
MIFNFTIFLLTLVAMEGVGFLAHKYVMHGWGWCLHKSHHEEHLGAFETNDIYLLALGMVAVALIVAGNSGHDPLQWVGAGVAAFGLIYVLVHDGLVHRHWPPLPRALDAPRGERPTQQCVVRLSVRALGGHPEKAVARASLGST